MFLILALQVLSAEGEEENLQKFRSFYPYIHFSYFYEYEEVDDLRPGLYTGLGIGALFATYTTADGGITAKNTMAMDFFAGVFVDWFDLSITIRTDYVRTNVKYQIGIHTGFNGRIV
jgi:hypothetical protein